MTDSDKNTKVDRAFCGPLDALVIPHGGYRTIIADPPWKYGKWGKCSERACGGKGFDVATPLPYQHMSTGEIEAMPVAQLAAENCDLYLWTTSKYLPAAFGVLEAWGFKYCQTLTWCKTPMGTGQGGLYCPTTEFLLLGRKGKMPTGKTRKDSTWWNVKRTGKHSKKPEFFQDLIEQMSDWPRIELFARRTRPGWDVWGNEV
jgi:N6-adenosine-specific RNA methylase IME4